MTVKEPPIGRDFLELIWAHDDALEQHTDARIPELGQRAPACLNALGTALSHLDRLASCFYGCRGGDHLIEYLTGRVYSLARASIRLIRFGHYDETLSLTRTIGEMANLLQLFAKSASHLNAWKVASKAERIRKFGPAAIRKQLEELGEPARLDQDWYSSICEWVTHPTPATKPNAFNILGVPAAAPHLQDEGILVCLNELGRALCLYTIPAVALINISKEERVATLTEVRTLGEGLGGVTLDKLPAMWSQQFANITG
jgi:hypothetical protein